MSICYVSRLYSGESGNLGNGTFADPYRPVTNPAVLTWLSTATAGSVLCCVDAMFGSSGILFLDAADIRGAARPGQPLIISGDPARWGDAPANAARAQRFGLKPLTPGWTQIGATGVFAATIGGLRAMTGLAYNIDARSDRGGVAQRDGFFERPTMVFHPQDCWAVPHTQCRARKAAVGAVAAGDTLVLAFAGSTTLALTARDGGLATPNSPGTREFVRSGTASATAANLAAVLNRALPLTEQVNDGFAAGVRAAWWSGGAGVIASNDKCGTGSGFTLEIANAGHGLWKTGQSQKAVQVRLRLRVDGASSVADGGSLRLELAKNAASGETFGLWLSRSGASYRIGANTSTSSAAASATIALDTVYTLEAAFDADRGDWWVWLDGVEIASGAAGTGPLSVTDVGVVAAAGSGAATNWRVYVDDMRVWYEDLAKPNIRHMSAWAHGSDVYLPQLYGETATVTAAASFTITSDVWLVHLAGEADPAVRSWYGADSALTSAVDIVPRTSEERLSYLVIDDMHTLFAGYLLNGLHGAYSENNKHNIERVWMYRSTLQQPAGSPMMLGHSIIIDRVTYWNMPATGPYVFLRTAPPSYDPPHLSYSHHFRDNLFTQSRLSDVSVFNASSLWDAVNLTSPNGDAHSIGLQSSRDVHIENVQAKATADLCIWFGGLAHTYATGSVMCPLHRPDIAGEDRVFWSEARTYDGLTGSIRNYWSEDQHRHVSGNERATSGEYGIAFENNPGPVDLDIYGVMVRGWPYGAPAIALRPFPALAGLDGRRGVRVRGFASLYAPGLHLGGSSEPGLWSFHVYDRNHPDRPLKPQRAGVEQRRRPGASRLGFLEGTVAKSVTGLAVAFTPSAPIASASLLAAGALSLWLRKVGTPGDITVTIGAGATPADALAAPAYAATIGQAAVSAAAGGAALAVTLSGSGSLAAGVKHWLVLTVATASASAYYQWSGWWGGRYPAFPSADLRTAATPTWTAEDADFSPYFTLATLGHAPASDFAAHVFALGDAAARTKLAQRFRPPVGLTVAALQLWMTRHNNALGATHMPVAIHADQGGSPGALVASFLPNEDVVGAFVRWVNDQSGGAAYLVPPIGLTLSANTDYWLVIGAPEIHATEYYRAFGCVDGAADGYGAKRWDGAAWQWLDATAQDRAKLYFTLWAMPNNGVRLPAWPSVAIDDMMVVSPRLTRTAWGGWDGAVRLLKAGGAGRAPAFVASAMLGNSKAGGSSFDPWVLTDAYDPARPVIRGFIAVGKAPAFADTALYPAESADAWASDGGASGFYRYANYELAANLGASEAHRGQLTATQWAERSRAAGAEFGRDISAVRGA